MSTMGAAVVLHSRAAGVPLMMLAFPGIPISAPGLKSAQVLAATIRAVQKELHLQLERCPLELLLLAWPPPSAPPLLAGPHLLLVPPLLAWLLPLVVLLPEVPTPKLVPRARRSWSLHSQHSWHHFQKCDQPHLDARCFSPEMMPAHSGSQAQCQARKPSQTPRNLCMSSAVYAVGDPNFSHCPHFSHCCPSQYQYLLWLIANPALHPVD
mmetsp:Transcript_116233/g.189329  ORF Transcript_116233/g.189329 Transcript_116233/m.189329 type:complete len:210 (+) Transcript_116233:1185-1814(+)